MIVKSKLSGRLYTDVYLEDGVYRSKIDDGLELDKSDGKRMRTVKRQAQVGEEILIVKISTEESWARANGGRARYRINDIFEVCKLSRKENSEAVFCDINGLEALYPFYPDEYVVVEEGDTDAKRD